MFPKMLGIDFGTKRVGLALSFGTLAEPLKIIEHSPNLIQELKELCIEEQVDRVIVGISEQDMANLTEAFISDLAASVPVPVEAYDETLTSYQAQQHLQEAGRSSPRRREIDHFAAAEMLQAYLDEVPTVTAPQPPGF